MAAKRTDGLNARRGHILRIIVHDYVEHAAPVGSEHIARSHTLGVSPATIRNDMAMLEEEGFIAQPHTSAGRVPSDKGYRYFVEMLMERVELPPAVRRQVHDELHQEGDLEEWTKAAAGLLSQLAHTMGLITMARPSTARFKHLELVPVQDTVALLIVVLQEGRVRQQTLHLDVPMTQDDLSSLSRRVSAGLSGLLAHQVLQQAEAADGLEETVIRTAARIMESADAPRPDDVQYGGLRALLQEPEFGSSQRLRTLMELVEDREALLGLLGKLTSPQEVRVVIGGENPEEALREFSMVVAPYGRPGDMAGAIAVMGPTRMRYDHAMAAVRYLAQSMTDLMTQHYG
jgi:heat-inducible transcriptional repressor